MRLPGGMKLGKSFLPTAAAIAFSFGRLNLGHRMPQRFIHHPKPFWGVNSNVIDEAKP